MNALIPSDAGSGTFPTFVSVSLVDLLATITLLIVVIGVVISYARWRRASPGNFFSKVRKSLGTQSIVSIFFSELFNRVLLQKDVINNDRMRRFTHLCMFWGFIGLGVTTTLDYIFNEPGNYIPLFGGSLSLIRLLGNVSGIVMMIGATIAIGRLIGVPKFRRGRRFWDVWFTSLLFITGLTGYIAEYYGEMAYLQNPNIPPAAAFSISLSASPLIIVPYGIHLASIGLLFISAPVSAFMHALTVPSLRYVDRLSNTVASKTGSSQDEHRRAKETAMIDQIKKLYEKEEN